jgi:lipoyl(octanoyl) transferase
MRLLEQVVMDTAARYGVSGGREPGATGVWVERMSEGRCAMGDGRQIHRTSDIETRTSSAKLCAMGVRVRKHTTMHGLALNVTTDLSRFGLIDPCGLGHRPVCSLRSLLGEHCPTIDTVKRDLSEVFIEALRSVQAEAARAT